MIQAQTLAALDRVQHRFFTRRGGVSTGLYSSLNCGYGSGDSPDNVRENRRRVAEQFGLDEPDLQTVHQTHSTDVLTVADGRWSSPGAPKADGLVTDRPGVVLGVLAADCAPVLLADPDAGIVAAAHAGWKGALGGVVEAVVAHMETAGADPDRIVAAIGPCIGPDSYEVGDDFQARFEAESHHAARFFQPGAAPDKRMFNLPAYVLHRLERAGVERAEWIGRDTYVEDALFFSNRRAVHRGEGDYGRLLSAIALD